MATVGELSKKYSAQVGQLQAIFPSWDESDLVFALQDAKGSLEEAVLNISEGRASQFTQATKKKPAKPAAKSHGSRNDGGWDSVDNFAGGRGGRAGGGRGGRGGARGAAQAVRGVRIGRGGARGGRGGLVGANGSGVKKTDAPADAWPTTTATTAEEWNNQVEQSEAASAHEDDGGWGDEPTKEAAAPAKPVTNKIDFAAAAAKSVEQAKVTGAAGAWSAGKPKHKPAGQTATPAAAPAPAAPVAAAAAPAAPAAAPAAAAPAAPTAVPTPAAPAAKPKMTWAQIAKPADPPKPAPAPPAPKAESVAAPEEPEEESQAVPEPEVEAEAEAEEEEVAEETVVEEAVVEEETPATNGAEEAAAAAPEEPAAPAAAQDSWASDPAIVASTVPVAQAAAPAAVPEPVTTYTGPPGFNTIATKAVSTPQPRTNSRAAQRFKADGQAVVLPAQASGVSSVEVQFGSLSFGGLNGDGVEAPVQAEAPAAEAPRAPSPVRAAPAPVAGPIVAPPPAAAPVQPAAAQAVPAAPVAASSWQQQQQAPQQPAGYPPSQTLQQQMQAYQSYGQQQPQQQAQQDQQHQQSQYYRQDYYNPIGSQPQAQQQQAQPQQQPESQQAPQQQAQPQQQPQQPQQQQQPQQAQQQQQQQHSYDAAPFGNFGSQGWNQPAAQQSDYGHAGRFDSYASYPRPPAEEPKQQAPAPSHAAAPGQPQQNLPHQQNQYYSALGNMGYYHSGPYNPYYQYGQAPNPGFQQYYPMAGRNLYGQPAPQAPPAPIPANKPTPPAQHHSPYGAPSYPSSSGFDDQSFGLGRYGDSNKAAAGAPQSGAGAQGQQNPQPIGGSLPQTYPSQQGLHNFLGGAASTSAPPNRPQAGTPEDSFKAQGAGNAASTPAQGARAQPQAQQAFASYPYGGYQNHEWSPYGQQQHYSGSRNGGYSGWQQ